MLVFSSIIVEIFNKPLREIYHLHSPELKFPHDLIINYRQNFVSS